MKTLLDSIGSFLAIISLSVLAIGLFLFFLKKEKIKEKIYVVILVLFELNSLVFNITVDIRLFFSISFFIHFAYITNYYLENVYKFRNKKKHFFLLIAALLLLTPNHLQSYVKFFYSLIITIYGLLYLYQLLNEQIKYKKSLFIFNTSIILFFCIDAFLSIATDYLISSSLTTVSWFWFIRAILLQIFYIAFIYHRWKTEKIH